MSFRDSGERIVSGPFRGLRNPLADTFSPNNHQSSTHYTPIRCISRHLFLRLFDGPRPFPFGEYRLLKPAIRPLKLADLVHLHNKGICLMCQAPEPIPTGCNGFRLGPSILGHLPASFSFFLRVCYSPADAAALLSGLFECPANYRYVHNVTCLRSQ